MHLTLGTGVFFAAIVWGLCVSSFFRKAVGVMFAMVVLGIVATIIKSGVS